MILYKKGKNKNLIDTCYFSNPTLLTAITKETVKLMFFQCLQWDKEKKY